MAEQAEISVHDRFFISEFDVPLMDELNNPIFAESVKLNIDPCQLFSFTTNRTGSPASPCNIWLNERSTDSIMSAFGRLCEIVIRNLASFSEVFSERRIIGDSQHVGGSQLLFW